MRGIVSDKITGFMGEVTARTEWATGPRRYEVQPFLENRKWANPQWFDEPRLVAEKD